MVEILRTYKGMDTPLPVYLMKYVAPAFFGTLFLALFFILAFPEIFGSGLGFYSMASLPPFILLSALLYPLAKAQYRAALIDQELHMFITRIGVLSTSDVSRKGIFNLLSEMKQYGELAREITKIFYLVDRWNISIAEACRVVSKTTPSTLFADFLDRLAHAVGTGADPRAFFRGEQGVVLAEYSSQYEGALAATEVMKEVYIAMVTATMFVLVLVAMLPLLWPFQFQYLFLLAVLLFFLVEGSMLFFFVNVIPREYVWQRTGIWTRKQTVIQVLLWGALGVTALLLLIVVLLRPDEMMIPIALAAAFTPLAIPGAYVLYEENQIRRRDDNFGAFIHSLGGSTEVAGTVSLRALERLRWHDFGPLTENINALYKRLALGIDSVRSWKFFGAETGSELISKFSTMYVEGTTSGARAGEVGEIISNNFIAIQALRKKRYQSASSMTGILYGVTVAITVPLFIMVSIVNRVQELVTDIRTTAFAEIPMLSSGEVNVNVLILLITLILLFHAFISSIISQLIAAGHKVGALVHFVGITWLGAVTALVTKYTVDYLLR